MYEKGTPLSTNSISDKLINSKVIIPHGESNNIAKVIQRYLDVNRQVIGNHIKDPILNTWIYDFEFQDIIMRLYAANVIAQNVLSQFDYEGC